MEGMDRGTELWGKKDYDFIRDEFSLTGIAAPKEPDEVEFSV